MWCSSSSRTCSGSRRALSSDEPWFCRSSLNRCARSGGSAGRSKPCAAAAPSSAVRPVEAICFASSRGRAALDRQHLLVRHPQRLGEHGAQALVPRHQVAERGFQRFDIEIAHQPHRQRDRVGRARAFQPVEEPQPSLRKRQRHHVRPRHRPQRCARPPAVREPCRQARHGRGLEQAADRDLDCQRRANAADQPRRQQRVAAKLEEVVVEADLGNAQRLGKQRAQHRLLRVARQTPHRARRHHRRRQRPAVELAVRRQRQPFQHDERRRHHVVGQQRGEMLPQHRSVDRRCAGLRHHVGHKPQRAVAFGIRTRPAPSRRATTAACATPSCRFSAASISPGSIRKPRSFTCASARPRKSSTPSARQRARSPVRYIRPPAGPNGSATNRSAVSPARPR